MRLGNCFLLLACLVSATYVESSTTQALVVYNPGHPKLSDTIVNSVVRVENAISALESAKELATNDQSAAATQETIAFVKGHFHGLDGLRPMTEARHKEIIRALKSKMSDQARAGFIKKLDVVIQFLSGKAGTETLRDALTELRGQMFIYYQKKASKILPSATNSDLEAAEKKVQELRTLLYKNLADRGVKPPVDLHEMKVWRARKLLGKIERILAVPSTANKANLTEAKDNLAKGIDIYARAKGISDKPPHQMKTKVTTERLRELERHGNDLTKQFRQAKKHLKALTRASAKEIDAEVVVAKEHFKKAKEILVQYKAQLAEAPAVLEPLVAKSEPASVKGGSLAVKSIKGRKAKHFGLLNHVKAIQTQIDAAVLAAGHKPEAHRLKHALGHLDRALASLGKIVLVDQNHLPKLNQHNSHLQVAAKLLNAIPGSVSDPAGIEPLEAQKNRALASLHKSEDKLVELRVADKPAPSNAKEAEKAINRAYKFIEHLVAVTVDAGNRAALEKIRQHLADARLELCMPTTQASMSGSATQPAGAGSTVNSGAAQGTQPSSQAGSSIGEVQPAGSDAASQTGSVATHGMPPSSHNAPLGQAAAAPLVSTQPAITPLGTSQSKTTTTLGGAASVATAAKSPEQMEQEREALKQQLKAKVIEYQSAKVQYCKENPANVHCQKSASNRVQKLNTLIEKLEKEVAEKPDAQKSAHIAALMKLRDELIQADPLTASEAPKIAKEHKYSERLTKLKQEINELRKKIGLNPEELRLLDETAIKLRAMQAYYAPSDPMYKAIEEVLATLALTDSEKSARLAQQNYARIVTEHLLLLAEHPQLNKADMYSMVKANLLASDSPHKTTALSLLKAKKQKYKQKVTKV